MALKTKWPPNTFRLSNATSLRSGTDVHQLTRVFEPQARRGIHRDGENPAVGRAVVREEVELVATDHHRCDGRGTAVEWNEPTVWMVALMNEDLTSGPSPLPLDQEPFTISRDLWNQIHGGILGWGDHDGVSGG